MAAGRLRTVPQRVLPAVTLIVLAETLRLWTILAHLPGQTTSVSQLGVALGGAVHTTAARQLAMLVDTKVVRRLERYFSNVGKRPVNLPTVCMRDCGLQSRRTTAPGSPGDTPARPGHNPISVEAAAQRSCAGRLCLQIRHGHCFVCVYPTTESVQNCLVRRRALPLPAKQAYATEVQLVPICQSARIVCGSSLVCLRGRRRRRGSASRLCVQPSRHGRPTDRGHASCFAHRR